MYLILWYLLYITKCIFVCNDKRHHLNHVFINYEITGSTLQLKQVIKVFYIDLIGYFHSNCIIITRLEYHKPTCERINSDDRSRFIPRTDF